MHPKHTFIIAEAGVNHNGSIDVAKQLISIAAGAGADAVKFQTFQAAKLVHKEVGMAAYQTKNIGKSISQYELLKSLELSHQAHTELFEYCQKLDIEFMSTPFDIDSIDLLEQLGVKRFKIGSGDLRNAPYLVRLGRCNKPIYVSTGMSDLNEIEKGLAFLVFGALNSEAPRSLAQALKFFATPEAQSWLKKYITVLHCVSQYPTPINDVNLNAIKTLHDRFALPVGYSDHSTSISIPVAAVALGAQVIEKHFTVDRSLDGPDHKASLNPVELKDMVERIREIDLALGLGIKEPTPLEQETYTLVGKRVVAAHLIKKGEPLTYNNITTMRAAKGTDAVYYYDLIGRIAQQDYAELDPISESL